MRNAQKTRELSLKAQEEAERARQRDMIFQKVQSLSLEYTRTFADVMSYTGWKDVEEFNEKYGWRSNPEAWSKLLLIERIYNSVGILLKENMVNADIVFELYPPNAIRSKAGYSARENQPIININLPTSFLYPPYSFLHFNVIHS
jgi:hypothetical protein